MNAFLKTYRLALTPLSPIHIGCGEDFEPTNYVIEDGVLYGFDPSRANLSDHDRSKLLSAASSGRWLDVSRFFRDSAALFKPHAAFMIPVSKGVAQQYKEKLGEVVHKDQRGRPIVNKLELERTQYSGITLAPFIPGTSFKGAIRTAILDALNNKRRPDDVDFTRKETVGGKPRRVTKAALFARRDQGWANDEGVIQGEAQSTAAMEKRLLQGDFETSPMRLLKVADLMPAVELDRRVVYAVMRRKRAPIQQDRDKKDPTARKECILHGQYRAFVAEAVLPSLNPHIDSKNTPNPALRPVDFKTIARQSNAYNQTRLRRELTILDGRGLVNPTWKASIDALLAGALGKMLAAGEAFLIRLGRYGGADNKTLTGEGVASIKIMEGKGPDGKNKFSFQSTTKTVWLAAEHENDQSGLLPFGWAVVEIDPKEGDLPELKAWCEAQSRGRPDMAALRQQFEADKQAALQQKAEQAALVAKALEVKKAAELAAQQRAQALASMTEQGRLIEALRQKCEDWASKMPPHGNFKHQKLNEKLFQDASKLVTQALADAGWQATDKAALATMLEDWLPKVVAPWGKDERKKLKIAALRGL